MDFVCQDLLEARPTNTVIDRNFFLGYNKGIYIKITAMGMQKTAEGVSHWVDGSKTWMLGISGFLLRIRGLLTSMLLIPLPLAGVPFWWPDSIPERVNFPFLYAIFFLVVFVASVVCITFFYIRWRTSRSLAMKSELHHLMHHSRDALGLLLSRVKKAKGRKYNAQNQHERQHICEYSKNICDIVAGYFSQLMSDDSIGCAIRIGLKNPQKPKDEIQYVTIGRSKALNLARETTSEPIPRSLGIPAFFLSDRIKCTGVLFYDDLSVAASNKCYVETENDKKYKEDIKTMIVAPINGWNGSKIDLIGLLYLTSKRDSILNPKHVDIMKFTADHLAIVYSSMLSVLQSSGTTPYFLKDDEDADSK